MNTYVAVPKERTAATLHRNLIPNKMPRNSNFIICTMQPAEMKHLVKKL